jgi:K+-transporting ATPase ATPase C chain
MFFRQILAGLRLLLVLTVVLGVGYPLLVWGIGHAAFRERADGSLLVHDGTVSGSTLIGQAFAGDQWFVPRPSANGYDALASGGSNAGPSDPDLLHAIATRRAEVAQREGVDPRQVPADAVTASASGLDAFISPAYARLQEARVARVRGLPASRVQALVAGATSGRTLGFLGEPRVNVVTLNAALAGQG